MKKNKDPGIKTKKTFREHGPFEDAFPSKNEWVFSVILVYNQVYHHFQGIQGGKDDNFLVKTSELVSQVISCLDDLHIIYTYIIIYL